MKADLQYDPSDIPIFLVHMAKGYDFVGGWRIHRKDSLFLRIWPSRVANIIAKIKLKKEIKDIGCSYFAFKRDLITQVKDFSRLVRFLKPCLITHAQKICYVEVKHAPPPKGKSQYSLIKLIKIALDFILHF